MKESTLESLDKAIAELKNSIQSVSDNEVRKELEKTLKNLVKAREKMNPARSFTSAYVVAALFVAIFVMLGAYYFSRLMRKECR